MDAPCEDELDVALAAARARAGAGEVGAIFDAHGAYVARVLRCLGVRDQELPDACQEVFVVVQRRLHELDGRAALRTWLYAICVRKALGLRRDAARRRSREVGEPSEASEPRTESTPEDELERTRKLAQALGILEEIAEEKRVVFVLYEVEQLPMSDVAEIVACPLQTAYSRLYAARREISGALRRLRAGGRAE
ncbi:MAG: RNA polymerase sigma factor [Myxococcota bacterium]|nr:RNA polymerase sigma factor [Myxococcota bacterium]